MRNFWIDQEGLAAITMPAIKNDGKEFRVDGSIVILHHPTLASTFAGNKVLVALKGIGTAPDLVVVNCETFFGRITFPNVEVPLATTILEQFLSDSDVLINDPSSFLKKDEHKKKDEPIIYKKIWISRALFVLPWLKEVMKSCNGTEQLCIQELFIKTARKIIDDMVAERDTTEDNILQDLSKKRIKSFTHDNALLTLWVWLRWAHERKQMNSELSYYYKNDKN